MALCGAGSRELEVVSSRLTFFSASIPPHPASTNHLFHQLHFPFELKRAICLHLSIGVSFQIQTASLLSGSLSLDSVASQRIQGHTGRPNGLFGSEYGLFTS
jgi:hypothetical protein